MNLGGPMTQKNPTLYFTLLLVTLLGTACNRYPGEIGDPGTQKKSEWNSKIEKFAHCNQVTEYVSSFRGQTHPNPMSGIPAMAAESQNQHYQNQVSGVLEGDILQTSSEHFFFARKGAIEVTQKKDLKKAFSLPIDPKLSTHKLIYRGDQLIFIGADYQNTILKVYDIKNQFVVLKEKSLPGRLSDFRVNENKLIIVSNYYFNENIVQSQCNNLYYPNWRDGSTEISQVSQFDLDTLSNEFKSIGVMGHTDYIYMTPKQLLLLNNFPKPHFRLVTWASEELKITQVEKLNGEIKDQSAISINNDFLFIALHERPENNFLGEPIATSDMPVSSLPPPSNTRENRVMSYQLVNNQEFHFQNSTPAFGLGEDIRAVKYLGDFVYVVTFRQTDPLFVIDLKDPKKLQIKGKLEVPGFSTQLEDFGEKQLGGIGFDATTESNFTQITGLKFSLFDIANPEKPLELDHLLFGAKASFSEATQNSKALYYNPTSQKIIFPVVLTQNIKNETAWGYEPKLEFAGAIILKKSGTQILEQGRLTHQVWRDKYCQKDYYYSVWNHFENTSNDIQRSFEIEDSIYSFSRFGIFKHMADSLNVETSLEYENSNETCILSYSYGAI
jgi:uncharacterized secreted protein with C-terminal beta-propeller domain